MQTTIFSSLTLLIGSISAANTSAQSANAATCFSFDLDCGGCTQTKGCFYCPADGLCLTDPLTSEISSFSRCSANEFVADSTCSYTDLYRSVSDGSDRGTPFYSDPLYSPNAWVFEMINLVPAWEKGYTGAGVRIRINDGGTDLDHPEFAGRFDESASCPIFLPNNYTEFGASHGANVASIVGASGNDGCSVGIAPNVTFSACNFFNSSERQLFASKISQIDIVQNSFGILNCVPINFDERRELIETNVIDRTCPFVDNSGYNVSFPTPFPCDACDFSKKDLGAKCEQSIINHCQNFGTRGDLLVCFDFLELFVDLSNVCFTTPSPNSVTEFRKGVISGRDGKGLIYIFSSGNEASEGGDVNFDGVLASRFTIPVGATSPDDRRSTFSVGGSALFLSAPGGSRRFLNDFVGAGLNGTCEAIGQGTSFSAPVVTGVIALMLEANPELTWRDVQGILAKTSHVPNVLTDDGRVEPNSNVDPRKGFITADAFTNAAGFTHSYGYGFGIVDASAAVEAAETWEMFQFERRIIESSEEMYTPIIDNPRWPTSVDLYVGTEQAGEGFILESVSVQLFFKFPPHGDLRISLASPQGTESILTPGNRKLFSGETVLSLTTVRSWGESPIGNWTLTLADTNAGDRNNLHTGRSILQRWRIAAYGRGGNRAPFTFSPPPTASPTGTPTAIPTAFPESPARSPIASNSGAALPWSVWALLLLSTALVIADAL